MNIPGFSTNGLRGLQKAIRKALEADDAMQAGQEKTFGVREFADWKEMSDALEAELDQRGEAYVKVPW